jgi:GNAT superfamily N-acetyltransferase
MTVDVTPVPDDFSNWSELLQLLQDAFAPMQGRIRPPSSVQALTLESIAAKSREENLFLALDKDEVVGCVFAKRLADSFYLSKLAVRSDRRGDGIGRRLMDAVEMHAREIGLSRLELDTRIELTENHATFAALGYVKTAEAAHDGYARPTFITMRKALPGSLRKGQR